MPLESVSQPHEQSMPSGTVADSKDQRESLRDILLWGQSRLVELDSREALLSVEQIVQHVTGLDRYRLYLNSNGTIEPVEAEAVRKLVERRKNREPLAYVLGRVSFWDLELDVREGCLIPRPETEKLIEVVHESVGAAKKEDFRFLDLGCGSGAIGMAILRLYPKALATFCDISETALKMTQENLKKYQLEQRARIVASDLFQGFHESEKWDMIISNPPYVSVGDWAELEPEVLWEPQEAFVAGADGLFYYRSIFEQASRFLARNGKLFLELGQGQSGAVIQMAERAGCIDIECHPDDNGIQRVLIARWAG